MEFKPDISTKINADFAADANKATATLVGAITKADHLKTDRIIRCIIFLAKGNLAALDKYIAAAIIDPRDVMLWAEYEQLEGVLNFKRIRDLNKTFDESMQDVKE